MRGRPRAPEGQRGVPDGQVGVPDGQVGVPDGQVGVPDGQVGVPDGYPGPGTNGRILTLFGWTDGGLVGRGPQGGVFGYHGAAGEGVGRLEA
jgi:hypothetical protein